MQGNPPLTTLTRLFRLGYPSYPRPQCLFLFFRGHDNKGKSAVPISELCFPIIPPLRHRPPPQLPIIFCLGQIHAMLCHSMLPHATGGRHTLRCAKYFLRALTLLFFCYCCDPAGSFHPLMRQFTQLKTSIPLKPPATYGHYSFSITLEIW